MATSTLPGKEVEDRSAASAPDCLISTFYDSRQAARPLESETLGGLLALVVIWAAWMYATWAHWGNLTVDSGREMYVAGEVAAGKLLYRDVWYHFGPVSPYFNGFLFRLFGVHLNVLYWAGSLSSLGSAILLYLTGMRLSSWLAGWTAAAVVVIQAFHPSMFSFPLPYSFASVYGCFVSASLPGLRFARRLPVVRGGYSVQGWRQRLRPFSNLNLE